jgi:hypothetical protein
MSVEPSVEAHIGATEIQSEFGPEIGVSGGVRINRTLHVALRVMGMRIRLPEERISYDVIDAGFILRGVFASIDVRASVPSGRLWFAVGLGAGHYRQSFDMDDNPYSETLPGLDVRLGLALLQSAQTSLDVSIGLKTFVEDRILGFQPSAFVGCAFN